MPDKSYSHEFHNDFNGGSMADLTVVTLPENRVKIVSSDERYSIEGPRSDLRWLTQKLEEQIAEDVQFNRF